MKELLESHLDTKVEIVAEQKQKKEIKLIDSQRKIPGLTLWEYSQSTGRLQQTTFKKQDFILKSLSLKPEDLQISNKVDMKESCIYFQALNRTNAEKKLRKLGLPVHDYDRRLQKSYL